MLCRTKIDSAAALDGRRDIVERLAVFLADMEAVGRALHLERDVVFQGLIQIHAGGVDFDSQAGSREVPMHQAK
eukprot:3525060-Prymnesium_polylepis.1